MRCFVGGCRRRLECLPRTRGFIPTAHLGASGSRTATTLTLSSASSSGAAVPAFLGSSILWCSFEHPHRRTEIVEVLVGTLKFGT